MADGDVVASHEDVVRYARPSDVQDGILDGSAFVRPEKDRTGLSVSRLKVFADDLATDLAMLRKVMGAHITLKRNGRLAQIAVSDIVAVGEIVGEALAVIEDHVPATDGKPANPAHAVIQGLPFKGAEQGTVDGLYASDLLAMRVSAEKLHAAV